MPTGPTQSLDSPATEWAKLGVVGLPVGCLALLVNVSVRRLLVTQGYGRVSLFGVPALQLDVPLLPFGNSSFHLGTWVAAWLEGLLHAGILTAYYVSMGGITIGAVFTVIGFVMADDPRRLLGGIELLARDRRVHVYLVFQLLFWIVSFNPWLVALAIEVATILLAAGSVFLITGSALLAVSDRSGPVATILVVHPLGALTLVLPPIAAALVSPAFRDVARGLTFDLTVWLLLNVLQPVGLSGPLQQLFDIEGPGFIMFWASLIVIGGWAVGAVRHFREEGAAPDDGRSLPLR